MQSKVAMKVLVVLALYFIAANAHVSNPSKKAAVFKSVKKCAREHGVNIKIASDFLKGKFSTETEEAKCFLKCVANDMQFWVGEKPQTSVMESYADLLIKNTDGVKDVIEKCIAADVSEDFCDHLYNVYRCFWDEVISKPNRKVNAHEDFSFEGDNELTKV